MCNEKTRHGIEVRRVPTPENQVVNGRKTMEMVHVKMKNADEERKSVKPMYKEATDTESKEE